MTDTRQSQNPLDDDVFEQRAEKLSRDALDSWTAEFTHDATAIKRLTGRGAKLLIGPRGSGKTTLMRRAYFQLLDDSNALPVYVNYSKSLTLEPLFQQNANALALFRQWLVMKVIMATRRAFDESKDVGGPEDLVQMSSVAEEFIERLESRSSTDMPDSPISPSRLAACLEKWAGDMKRGRVVVLMDDAAHAFSAPQQRDFFEFFRSLKSRKIAPKAAVYPGITEYSPYFHVGHDGDLVEAWADLSDANFLESMRSLFHRRFSSIVAQRLEKAVSVVSALAYASFGLPRSYINMLGSVIGDLESPSSITWSDARNAVRANADSMRSVFTSLKGKLPRYRSFVDIGSEFEEEAVDQLRKFNKDQAQKRAVSIAIKEPLGNDAAKILSFLEYAGIVRKLTPVSRGKIGRYERYMLHFSIIIEKNALALGRSPSAQGTADALGGGEGRPYPKLTVPTLFGKDLSERCIIDLSPCTKCGTPRLSAESHFCHKCGQELTDVSVYDEALRASVDVLPITDAKKTSLHNADLHTVHDIILAEPGELRKIPSIGESWAARIKTVAEEHASV